MPEFKARFAHACDVHRLLHGDSSPKASAKFCKLCGAWICDECRPKVGDRIRAALKTFLGRAA